MAASRLGGMDVSRQEDGGILVRFLGLLLMVGVIITLVTGEMMHWLILGVVVLVSLWVAQAINTPKDGS